MTSTTLPRWNAASLRGLLSNLDVLVLPVICLLPVLLYAPFLTEPFERDEGVYATIAQGIMRGDVPYRDLFDHKPPLVYVWYVLSFALFGEGVIAPRLLASIFWALTSLVIFKQVDATFSRREAITASLVFSVSCGLVLLQASANTEVFMLLPAVCCLYAATKAMSNGGTGWLIATGISGALAILTKQVAVIGVLTLVLLLLYQGSKVSWRESLRRGAVVMLGAVVVFTAALTPFLLAGALDDFLYSNWTYNRIYSTSVGLAVRIATEIRGVQFFLVRSPILVALAALGAAWSLRRDTNREARVMLLWLAAAYAGVVLGGRAYPHYYVTLLPGLAIFAGMAVAALLQHRRRINSVLIPSLGLALAITVYLHGSVYLEPTPEAKHLAKYSGVEPMLQNAGPRLGAQITAMTSADDEIYNLGHESELYFYSDRKPAARFLYHAPFELDSTAFDETIAELRADPPRLIVDSTLATGRATWEETHPPSLEAFLDDFYVHVGEIEYAQIYVRKSVN
jgi:4-amino-4-deoxy-L-arabinose transferase-like glycosyltransferase